MTIVSKIFIYILILVAILQNWLWLALPLIILFSLRCGAVSLIPLAVLIDAYFGNFYHVPYLSLASIVWYLVASSLRTKVVNLKFS